MILWGQRIKNTPRDGRYEACLISMVDRKDNEHEL